MILISTWLVVWQYLPLAQVILDDNDDDQEAIPALDRGAIFIVCRHSGNSYVQTLYGYQIPQIHIPYQTAWVV